MLRTRRFSLLGVGLLFFALLVSKPAGAFSIGSGFSDPCHERITLAAYQNYLLDLELGATPIAQSGSWQKLADAIIKQFELEAYNDRQRIFIVSLLIGVRSPDTDGHAILDLESSRVLHTSPEGQYQHALRALEDDGPDGDRKAVAALRKHIKDRAFKALEAYRTGDFITNARVYLDFYGLFETEVLAPGYYLGQAIHALQDSFSHSLRSDNFHRIRHVMNYAEAMGGTHDEARDGLAHSVSMDQCTGETAPLVRAAEEATISLLVAMIKIIQGAEKTGNFVMDPLDSFLDDWVSYDENELGCTVDNDYCGSYWVGIARDHQTKPIFGCSLGAPTGRGLASSGSEGALMLLLATFLLALLRRWPWLARPRVLGLVGLFTLLGCPSDPPALDTELDCENPPTRACGGAVQGEWGVTAHCGEAVDASALIPGCDGITLTPEGGMIGTLMFRDDGKLIYNATQRSRMRWKIPVSCLAAADTCMASVAITECQDLVAVFSPGCDGNSSITDGLFNDGIVCTTQDDVCACSVTEVTPSISEHGSYTTKGAELHWDGKRTLDFDYCVEDRIMTLSGDRLLAHPFGPLRRHLRLLKRR